VPGRAGEFPLRTRYATLRGLLRGRGAAANTSVAPLVGGYSCAVHDDEPAPDDELAEEIEDGELTEDDAETTEQDENARMLSIRRADGEEEVSIVATGDEWSVHLQPGGAIRNAFIGTRTETPVWLNTWDREIERDEDGTYVIRLD
jgi:hypothetical protein